ncbi:hypothetical protein MTO96_009871 [Rhipicephalus appendiculatus]
MLAAPVNALALPSICNHAHHTSTGTTGEFRPFFIAGMPRYASESRLGCVAVTGPPPLSALPLLRVIYVPRERRWRDEAAYVVYSRLQPRLPLRERANPTRGSGVIMRRTSPLQPREAPRD